MVGGKSVKDKKGKKAEAGEIWERSKSLCTKGGHRCAEQKECISLLRLRARAHAHTPHTHTQLPLRFNTGADASQ